MTPEEPTPTTVLDTGAAGNLVMRGGILRLAGYGAGSGLAVVSAVILTRHLGVSRFGQYTTIISIATIATQLLEGGLTGLTVREYAASPGERSRQRVRDLLGLQVFCALAAVALATAFAVAAGYDPRRILATSLATAGLGLLLLQTTAAVPLVAGLRYGWVSGIELLRQAVFVGLTVLLALAGAGLLPLLAALVPSSVAALGCTVALTRRSSLRPSFRPRAWRALAAAAVAFTVASIVASTYVATAQVLTSLVANAHETGLFSVAFRVFTVLGWTSGLVAATAYPLIARTARTDQTRMVFVMQRLFHAALLLGLGTAVAVIAGADTIIKLLAGSRYHAAAPVLRIEGAALLGSWITAVSGYAVMALDRRRALLGGNLAAMVVTAGLTLALAGSYGARGTAVASAVGEGTLACVYLVSLTRSDRRLRPGAGVIARLLLAAGAAAATTVLDLPGGVHLVLALVVYAVAVVALRAFPPELLELIPGRTAPLAPHDPEVT